MKLTSTLFLLSTLLLNVSSALAAAPDGNYKIDPDHSNIGFEVIHLGIGIVVGRFDKFDGEIKIAAAGGSQVTVNITPSSVNTKVPQRDQHLRTADFFDVSQFPDAKFVSTKVDLDDAGEPKSMDGTLTLHGVTKPLTISLSPVGTGKGQRGETRAGFRGRTTINRKDFGMNSLLAIAGEEVILNLTVEAIKQ